jgi:hypothetical protein
MKPKQIKAIIKPSLLMNIEGFGNFWSVVKRNGSDEDSEGQVI